MSYLAEVYVDLVLKETFPGELNQGALLCEVGDSGILLIPENVAMEKELV